MKINTLWNVPSGPSLGALGDTGLDPIIGYQRTPGLQMWNNYMKLTVLAEQYIVVIGMFYNHQFINIPRFKDTQRFKWFKHG